MLKVGFNVGYKISIIIAVYNVERFLYKGFESLKRQTIGFENLQVIFADDCSTDKSWELVQELAASNSNVEAVRLPQNSGACGAPRNAAIELAKAKYFMCFDPDDELPDNACRLLYEAIERTGTDFAFGYHKGIDVNGMVQQEKPKRYEEFDERIYNFPEDLSLFIPQGVPYWTKIYKTAFHREKNLCFPVGIPGQDTVCALHYLFESKSAVYINEPVYNYTIHPGSISFSHTKRFFMGINQCYLLCSDLFDKYRKTDQFGVFIGGVLPFYLNKMYDSTLTDAEIEEIFEAWAWMWEYYAESGFEYGSEYAEIMAVAFPTENRMVVYKNLSKLRLYTLELERAKVWYLEQIENRDREIESSDREIENRDKLIENRDREIENRDKLIENRDRIIGSMDREIENMNGLLSKKLVKIALKFSRE